MPVRTPAPNLRIERWCAACTPATHANRARARSHQHLPMQPGGQRSAGQQPNTVQQGSVCRSARRSQAQRRRAMQAGFVPTRQRTKSDSWRSAYDGGEACRGSFLRPPTKGVGNSSRWLPIKEGIREYSQDARGASSLSQGTFHL
jgi:hypothetical protein